MVENQSWETCKFAVGNLEIDRHIKSSDDDLAKFIQEVFVKSENEKLLEGKGIDTSYYCTCPEVVDLSIFRPEDIFSKDKGLEKAVRIFYLEVPKEGFISWEFYGMLARIGVQICTICPFYEPK